MKPVNTTTTTTVLAVLRKGPRQKAGVGGLLRCSQLKIAAEFFLSAKPAPSPREP
jgi:hypothetical protein